MLDLARDDDKAVLAAMLAKADVFVQNLKPGAIAKLGFPLDELRRAHPRLIICSISGYGEDGPYAARKAYDMLIQAESGLASVTGSPDAPARVGVSVCDIAAGMNAYEAILEALIAREQDRRRRRDLDLHVRRHGRLDGGAADAIRGRPAAAPHRPRAHLDRALRRVQDQGRRRHSHLDPERPRMARAGRAGARRRGAGRRSRLRHQRRAGQAPRRHRRARCRRCSAPPTPTRSRTSWRKPTSPLPASTTPPTLATHPQLRRIEVATPVGAVSYPAPAARRDGAPRRYGAVPALGEHSDAIRAEFMAQAQRQSE